MKLLTIGSAMQDVFIEYKQPHALQVHMQQEQAFIMLPEGKKIEVDAVHHFIGGGGLNSAASFTQLGLNAVPFAQIGADRTGDFIIEKLNKKNISTAHIVRTQNSATGASFILPCASGDRSVLVHRGANLLLHEASLPDNLLTSINGIYAASLSHDASQLLPLICKQAQKNNIPVAVNPGTSQLTIRTDTMCAALPSIDILMLNRFEAGLLMACLSQPTQDVAQLEAKSDLPPLLQQPLGPDIACFTLKQFFTETHKHGPRIVVVTNGADGVYVSDGTQIMYHKSQKANVVSTLGAGDAFGSTFVAMCWQNKSLEYAIKAGIANCTSVLAHLDTQTGLLKPQTLEQKIDAINYTPQIFPF